MEMSQLLWRLFEYAKQQLSSLAHLRDGFLVIGGALYILGYFAWCLYALSNNLSLPPALSSQYIMAGGILVSFLFGFAALRILREYLLVWLDPPEGWKLLARWAILVALIYEFLLFFLLPLCFGMRAEEIDATVFLATSLLAVPVPRWREALEALKASVTTINNNRVRDILGSMVDQLSRLLSVVARWIEIEFPFLARVLVCVIGLFFMFFAFLALPQQLGGVHAGCAYLDIAKGTISKDVRDAIIAPAKESQDQVARSDQLDVLFEGSDTIFVRSRKPDSTKVYEISRKIVQAITWCD